MSSSEAWELKEGRIGEGGGWKQEMAMGNLSGWVPCFLSAGFPAGFFWERVSGPWWNGGTGWGLSEVPASASTSPDVKSLVSLWGYTPSLPVFMGFMNCPAGPTCCGAA